MDWAALQVVSGVSLDAYWVTSFAWDCISLIIPAGFTIIILAAFDVKALISGEAAAATILLFLFFGLSMVRASVTREETARHDTARHETR